MSSRHNPNKRTVWNDSKDAAPLQRIRRQDVTSYWKDVEDYAKEPGFFSFSHDDQANGPLKGVDKMKIEKALARATSAAPGKSGDLLPSAVARECCQMYEELSGPGRRVFLELLGGKFGVPREEATIVAHQYLNTRMGQTKGEGASTETALRRIEGVLRHLLQPAAQRFFHRVGRLPGGMSFLVDLREDLQGFSKEHPSENLSAVDEWLRATLQEWLVGYLELERITWTSPAILLERMASYEAVHAFRSWGDMRRRLGPGRRCFAFFHRAMPFEPLVFVQIALTTTIADNVQAILNDRNPGHRHHDTVKSAIFYSITSRKGLGGVELGSFLIKRVIGELQIEFPGIEHFCTLSPIPKFRSWLEWASEKDVREAIAPEMVDALLKASHATTVKEAIKIMTQNERWYKTEANKEVMQGPLLALAARYLVGDRRNGLARDPVANFHLRNGACVHRLNWLANTSDKGLSESFGVMVNYNYLLHHVEANNQRYVSGGCIAVNRADPLLYEAGERALKDGVAVEYL